VALRNMAAGTASDYFVALQNFRALAARATDLPIIPVDVQMFL